MRLATFVRVLLRFEPEDDDLLDAFDVDPLLDLLPADRPVDDLRDDDPPDEVFDLLPDEELLDPRLDDELLPLPLFEPLVVFAELVLPPVELFDELDRPADDLDEPLAFRPEDDDDEDVLDLPDEPDELRPELDFDLPPPLLDREDELLALVDRLPLLDADERPPGDVIVSAAAPIAPMAAPDAAPVRISPATSITLSTIAVVVFFDLDDLPRDEVDEDELLFRERAELDLLAINFPPSDRNKKLNCL